jgi:hypothetical protein
MGYMYITRGTLSYMCSVREKSERPMQNIVASTGDESNISSLTGLEHRTPDDESEMNEETNIFNEISNINYTFGDRPKGSTDLAKSNALTLKNDALIEASKRLKLSQIMACNMGAKSVADGTLQRIIFQVEAKYNLPRGSLSPYTVVNRVRRNNITGEAYQKISPLIEVEPLIVECCLQLALIGSPLDKNELLALVKSMICGTVHADRFHSFKVQRHLNSNEDFTLGQRWYNNFMERKKDKIKRGAGKINDVKQHTWCTYDAFSEMYNSVYSAMVEA